MTVVGGLRTRFLIDSLQAVVREGMTAQGWFAPGRAHAPLQILDRPQDWDEPVAPNSVTITAGNIEEASIELGSDLTTKQYIVDIDIYAETDALGTHVANDLRDLLRGRLPNGARNRQVLIYDYRLATPQPIASAVVESVSVVRNAARTSQEWAAHWFRVHCEVQDTYFVAPAPYPGPDLFPVGNLFPG